jgi:Outer membrane protein beta-barrel domain
MNIRTLASIAFLSCTTLFATAQSYYKMGFSFGANYSSLRSDLFTTSSGRPGIATGFSMLVGINETIELNQEILFVQKGANAKVVNFLPEQSAETSSYAFYYNTFEAATFVGYRPSKNSPLRIQAGGFFGTHFHNLNRTNREVYLGNYEDFNLATRAVDLNDAFSGLDFGPAVGISAGEGRLRANLRYYHGLRNMYNNLDFVQGGNVIRTNAARFTLTWFF